MLVVVFLPFVHGGIETVAIMAKSESCLNNGTTKMCQAKGSVTLALLPAGQPNVLSIKTDDGLILGTLQVILKGLSLECQAFTKAWKRSYEIASLASKRCPSAGSCVGDFCAKVRPSTAIRELRETEMFPGTVSASTARLFGETNVSSPPVLVSSTSGLPNHAHQPFTKSSDATLGSLASIFNFASTLPLEEVPQSKLCFFQVVCSNGTTSAFQQ
ncbi:hypothetical protein niasHT_008252 [Heterodera trifolii]|uniref:Phlebovirus glycoprotein G2 fusion domain-containing protein n=1 Tax=Heterodera trifolii TaxID=157864 RepID=A0ABD2M3E2_9BILA